MRVFVLLFNAGTENEGIHTLNVGDKNIVLMFEEEDDATRYSLLLEAQDFMTPTVEPIDREEVEEFCGSAHYECRLVPKGFVPADEFDRLMIAPPQRNLEQTQWAEGQEPDLRPLEGVGPAEEAAEEAAAEAAEEPADFAQDELDSIRRRLEGLL